MNPPSGATPPARPPVEAHVSPRAPDSDGGAARTSASLRGAFIAARFHEDATLRGAIKEARRYVRIRYFGFLAALVLLFATVVIAAAVLIASLLWDASWEQQAASGTVAATALVMLLLLQYRPVDSFTTASADITRLEAIGSHIERSYAIWDAFLEQRADQDGVEAGDVALAVSSMTSAVKETMAIQTAAIDARRQASGGRAAAAPPTPTMPDPRRY